MLVEEPVCNVRPTTIVVATARVCVPYQEPQLQAHHWHQTVASSAPLVHIHNQVELVSNVRLITIVTTISRAHVPLALFLMLDPRPLLHASLPEIPSAMAHMHCFYQKPPAITCVLCMWILIILQY